MWLYGRGLSDADTHSGRGLTGRDPLVPVGGAGRGHAPSLTQHGPPHCAPPPNHGPPPVPHSDTQTLCPMEPPPHLLSPPGGATPTQRVGINARAPPPCPPSAVAVSLHVAFLQQLLGDPAVLGGASCLPSQPQQHRGGFRTRPPLKVSADLRRGSTWAEVGRGVLGVVGGI